MTRLLLILSISFGINAFGQTDEQIKEISEETCDCMKGKDLEVGDMTNIQMELGICMLAAMNENGVEVDLSDYTALEEIGERVGFELAFSCPRFLELIGQISQEDPEGFSELMEDYKEPRTKSSFGTVLEIESDDFVTLKIKTDEGKKEVFYWFEHFEGAELLEDGGASLLQKDVFIDYEVIEYYSPKIEDYTSMKVLRGIMTAE